MDNRYFLYDDFVTGKNFLGRRADAVKLRNLLCAGENVVLYEPPKAGKTSLIQQTLFDMRMSALRFSFFGVDVHNVRSLRMLLTKFADAVIRSVASTPFEYETIIRTHLEGTHFLFDQQRFAAENEVVSMNWDPDANDVFKVFSLPSSLAAARGEKTVTVIDEFQSIERLEESDMILRVFREALRGSSPSGNVYVITGSRFNQMKDLFHTSPFFHGLVERLPLSQIDHKAIVEHMVRNFSNTGKEIQRDRAMGVAAMFRGEMWYINHFCSLCDSLTKGYVNESVMMSALKMLISSGEPAFKTAVENLTIFQINFLLAVIEGVERFTSSAVIRKYSLNSSANVARVKDALLKKEIIALDERDNIYIPDPLFEYWLRRYYFEKQEI